MKFRLFTILLLCLLLGGCAGMSKTSSPGGNNFELQDSNGQMVQLAEYRGKTILLHFWATWCPACVTEMRALELLYQKLDHHKFAILALGVGNSSADLKTFALQQKVSFPMLSDQSMEVSRSFKVIDLPATVLIDGNGNRTPFPTAMSQTKTAQEQMVGPQPWDSGSMVSALTNML